MVPNYILVGAKRWLELLQTSSTSSAMAIFMSNAKFSDLTFSNYREAYEWIEQQSLLTMAGANRDSLVEAVFLAALREDSMIWLQDGEAGVPSPDFLPEPVLGAAIQLGIDPNTAWEAALGLGRKVDLEYRTRIGLLGECAVVAYAESLGAQVEHVSLSTDSLGWDIRVSGDDFEDHLEVKTTTSFSRMRFFLSRNEFEVAKRDPLWGLALVLIDPDGNLLRTAHVSKSQLEDLVPTDRSAQGRWESCSITASSRQVTPGLPGGISRLCGAPILAESTEPIWWPQA